MGYAQESASVGLMGLLGVNSQPAAASSPLWPSTRLQLGNVPAMLPDTEGSKGWQLTSSVPRTASCPMGHTQQSHVQYKENLVVSLILFLPPLHRNAPFYKSTRIQLAAYID